MNAKVWILAAVGFAAMACESGGGDAKPKSAGGQQDGAPIVATDGPSEAGGGAPDAGAGDAVDLASADTGASFDAGASPDAARAPGDGTPDALSGDGTLDAPSVACVRPGPRAVRGLSVGASFSLAVLENGDALLWGGALGPYGGEDKPPRPLLPPTSQDTGCGNAVEAAGGRYHACLRMDNGEVRCWGNNTTGELGLPPGPQALAPAAPADLGGRKAIGLAAGHGHTCARLDNGQLRCFGSDVLDNQNGNALIPFPEGRKVTAVGAGHDHTCAVLDDGQLRCWGRNESGQLGLGDTDLRLRPEEPVPLGEGRTAVEVGAGFEFTCARLDDGAIKCWGRNDRGQLGLGDTSPRPSPSAAVALGAGRKATQLALGFDFACARLDDGAVKCWGGNDSGQLGLGTAESQPAPTGAVSLGAGRTAVELASRLAHVCARLDDGTVKCWGHNSSKQLGVGDQESRGNDPDELGDKLPAVPLGQ